MDPIRRQTYNTVRHNTNEGSWVPKHAILVTLNSRYDADAIRDELDALVDDGLLRVDGEQYQPVDPGHRILHPGEVE